MTMSLAPALLSSAATILPPVINALSNSSSSHVADQPVGSSDRILLSTSALPSAPTPQPERTLGGHFVDVPFQHLFYDLTGTETKSTSTTVQVIAPVKSLIQNFRDAQVVSLEAVVFPTANSLKIPVTVDLAWTPADVTASGTQVITTPGSARVTVGGLNLLNQGVLPCNLNYVNPCIKSPLPYTNHPRLNVHFMESPDAKLEGVKATIKASVFIRGILRLGHPLAVSHQ
ncbi:coat protein [Bee Macula-Like virus 2]|uniref:coat protein n=1 Tax=Bee Macula-Like virus 2 TaxID=2094260 RepID=UPI000D0C3D70|nr:coat protein [Bee Macula-Like virus 2]AVH76850.1 coat protein [Bee Macula-Like virus 2]